MKEKKPKSTIVVLATMIFLAMFIVLPPLFRIYFPKEEIVEEKDAVLSTLSCERVSPTEALKITMKILYEDSVPVNNTITYISYAPTPEEIVNDPGSMTDMTAQAEINYFKSIADIEITENVSQTIVIITDEDVSNNPEQIQLTNYLADSDVMTSNFEAQGYICTMTDY